MVTYIPRHASGVYARASSLALRTAPQTCLLKSLDCCGQCRLTSDRCFSFMSSSAETRNNNNSINLLKLVKCSTQEHAQVRNSFWMKECCSPEGKLQIVSAGRTHCGCQAPSFLDVHHQEGKLYKLQVQTGLPAHQIATAKLDATKET